VYIIDEVHMLSRSAFNAMLKTLEEPPAHVKFVLATTDPQKIPVTVLSRCLQFNLKQIPQQQIRDQLQKILGAENVSFEVAALALLARAAQGSMRDGLSLLDQAIAHGGGKVEEAAVRAMLGAVDQTYLYAILRSLAAADGAGLIAQAEHMAARSLSFESALQDLGTLLHRLALLQAVPETVTADDPDHAELTHLSELFVADDLQLYYQIALQGRAEIGLAPDEYAGFTMTLLRMLAFAPGDTALGGTARSGGNAAVAGTAKPQPVASKLPKKSIATKANWGEIVDQLGLTGMARMLAQHCELVKHDSTHIDLCVARAHERLLEKPFLDKLKTALMQHFGGSLHVAISVGDGGGNSPAEISDRQNQRLQVEAVAEIEQDPFVRDLVENFDARVIDSTIKPLQNEDKR
jgi:DNA polymerase-3 subunit gamma/tau